MAKYGIAFEQLMEVFCNPDKFKKSMEEYQYTIAKLDAKLALVKKIDEIEDSHGAVKALEHNAQIIYDRATEDSNKYRKEGASLIEEAQVKVRDIDEESAKREKAVCRREIKLTEESGRIQVVLERNEKTLTEILTKTSYLEGSLKTKLMETETLRQDLAVKLIKVNELLGE